MPRHQHATTWRRESQNFNITLTASGTALFTVIQNETNLEEGSELRHLEFLTSYGTINTTPPTVMSDFNSGVMGFFKWPVSAVAPTVGTFDLTLSNLVFARRLWVCQHDIPRMTMLKWPKVILKPGEQLIHGFLMTRQSGAAADVHGLVQASYVSTKR